MNIIFFSIVAISFLFAGWRQLNGDFPLDSPSPMEALTGSVVDSAAGSVELAIGLIGVMTLFLGLMKIVEKGGLLSFLSLLIRPLMVRLFPGVPPDHPAMGAMILNMSSNAMGLGNASTPFGIKAMEELESLNKNPGTATDSMALFLAINTSSVTLLPTGVIALRAATGSQDPAGILPTTLFATICSTCVAICAAKLYARFWRGESSQEDASLIHSGEKSSMPSLPLWASVASLTAFFSLIPITLFYGKTISPWIIPGMITGFLFFGVIRKVPVYEVFVEGAKEGFKVAVRIIPYLVAILVAVSMFRASGAMELIVGWAGRWTSAVGMPAEALPMALMRPLSGSGAYGILASIIDNPSIGPDSYTGFLVSTLQGSTETTFYVLAVYFGAVQVKRIRHSLVAALTGDMAGVVGAVVACRFLFF